MNPRLLIKTATLLLALCISTQSFSQAWNTVGNGLPNISNPSQAILATASDSTGVYVATVDFIQPNNTAVYTLHRWNGLVWNSVVIPRPVFPNSYYSIYDMAVFGGKVYICGNNAWNATPINVFDGVSWSTIAPPALNGTIKHLEVVNGELICAGNFTANINIDKLMRYNGTSFFRYPNLSWLTDITDIIEFNGDLYISGSSNSNVKTPTDSTLLRYNPANYWEGPAQFSQGTGGSMTGGNPYGYRLSAWQGKLALLEGQQLFFLQTDSIKLTATASHYIFEAEEFNNNLFLCGAFAQSGFASISFYDGTSITPMNGSPNKLNFLENLNQELYAFSLSETVFNGVMYNRAFRTDAVSTLAHGIAFYDINNNCMHDTLEGKLNNVIVMLDGSFYSGTDTNGQYTFSIAPGTHSIDTVYTPALVHKNVKSTCTPITFTIAAGQTLSNEIGFSNVILQDATVKLTANRGWRALYGFTEKYTLEVSNAGANTLSTLNLNIQVPNSLVIDSISVTPSSQVMNLLTFQINNLQAYQTAKYELFAIIDTGMNSLGDSLQWNMWLDPITADLDQSDNADTLHQTVSGAYDPNDKTASAEYISPTTKRIDYHIRFQNTGTDTAYKVVVVDSLNTSLALTNVVINSASHPYNFSVQNNVLVWEFENILLPDSGADYLGSQGYVNFSTGINPALGLGDSVTNDANIYFDFQWPITTNTAKTTIVNNISVLEQGLAKRFLEVYPNPARDIIRIKNTSATDLKVQITNTNGQIIYAFTLKPNEELGYECSSLLAGMYILSTPFESYKILMTN